MTSDPITRLNAALEGRYRVERELGEGGMAVAYFAEDLRHHRKVARKLLPALLIALNVSCGAGLPDQTRASGPPRQDIDFEQARRQMVEEQIGARGVTDSRVLEAMLWVPRHEYVPLEYRASAYSDTPLPIGLAQTISQPTSSP